MTDTSEKEVQVPLIKMRRAQHIALDEVVVTTTKIKMFYRGDTLIYDATAFQLPEGSMLDDLIRQLPGEEMNKKGEIIFGKRVNPNNTLERAPHPTLIGGKDPQAQCAGIIKFKDGRIFRIDNQSGHFRPNIKSLNKIEDFMQKLYDENPLLFHKSSKWRLQ